jgi:hypothetical protein
MASANIHHTWTTSIKNDSGAAVTPDPPLILVGDGEVNFSQTLNPGDLNIEVDVTITVLKIISAFVNSTQACTMYTNSSTGSGGQAITLQPNLSVSWNNTQTTACPFTPNITKFFLNNPSASVATERGGFLIQTP